MSRPRDRSETAAEEASLTGWLDRRVNLTEIFSLLPSYGLFPAEIDSRKPLKAALAEVEERPWPSFARWPRVLGLIVMLLLFVQFVTGGLLALYYLPTPETAHASLGTIVRHVDYGWFIHQMHSWGSQVLLLVLGLRLVRFFLTRSYRPPRELLWVFAAALLLVCFHLDLSGKALPFTEASYWSTIRALEIAGSVPIYGGVLMFLLGGGGAALSELALIRFYVLHVAVLPAVAIFMLYLHFSSLRRVGSTDRAAPSVPGTKAFRVHVANIAILLTVAFALLISLAILAPSPFEAEADAFTTVPGIGPPWYLLAPFGFLEWSAPFLPRWLAGTIIFLTFVAFLGLPFWDRSKGAGKTRNTILGVLFLVILILLSVYGARVA